MNNKNYKSNNHTSEAAVRRWPTEKVLLKISQNFQEETCV